MLSRPALVRLTALFGLVGVAFGAYGAHGGLAAGPAEWMRTGAAYQLIHAAAALGVLALTRADDRGRWAAPLFLLGSLLFSGSLYAMALGAPRWLGAVTPLGGLSLLAGWATLAFSPPRLEA